MPALPDDNSDDARLPPRVSPGWLALADQLDAAAAHARRVATRMVTECEGVVVGVLHETGPWTSAILASVAPDNRRLVCSHIEQGPPVRPMYVLAPHLLGCWDCMKIALEVRQSRPDCCERCGRPADDEVGETAVVIAQRHQLIALGELCPSCLTIEIAGV